MYFLKLYIILTISVLVFNSCENPKEEDLTPPAPPLNLAYNLDLSGDGQIYLFWEAPLDDDLSAFHIYRDPGTQIFTEIYITTNTFFLDTGLDYLVEYRYKVSAMDKNGNESIFSNILSQMPLDLTAPHSPQEILYQPDLSGDREIYLSWTQSENDGVAIFHVYRDAGSGVFTIIDSTVNTFYIDTNLEYSIEYSYKVNATDGSGNISPFSDIMSQSPPDLVPPQTPSGLQYDANLSGGGQIFLTWNANVDDVNMYFIYRDSGSGIFSIIDSTNETQYLNSGLDCVTEYRYKITATDLARNVSDFSDIVSFTATSLGPPDPPSGLVINAHNIPDDFEVNVELTWNGNTETDFAYYKIFRSATTPLFSPDEESYLDSVTGTFYIDEDVTPGNTYHYKLIASDLCGLGFESSPTNVVSDTPLEAPVLIGPIGDVSNISLTPTFEWTNVNEAVRYKIVVRTSSATGDIWDFELDATTENTMSVTYPTNATTPLHSNTRYWWFIAGYSQTDGEINVYSEDTTFRTF